jgi:hypothetical protein
MYVNNLMSYLQNLNKPQVAQSVGIAAPVRPVMVSTGTGTDAPTRMVSGGIQATIATATAETGTDARPAMATTETQTARRQNYRAGFINILDRLEPPMPRNVAATLAAQVPLPPSPPPSVVGTEERTFGTQTEPTGTGARAVNKFMAALKPAIIAQRARQTATGETQTTLQAAVGETQTEAPAGRTFGTQTVQPVIEIAPPGRRGNYQAGFYNILPTIVPPAALAAQVRDIGMVQGYRQGRQRGEAIGAQAAVEGLRFTQRTKARGDETFTVPELQQRFAEGQIIRSYQRVGAGGGGAAAAVQAVAEEAAPK